VVVVPVPLVAAAAFVVSCNLYDIAHFQSSGGGTNIKGALNLVNRIAMRCNAEKAVFLISDGRDNVVTNELDAILHSARRKGK
jgi:Mg-chelatase subunit ChlD